jgi:hypothetical protein
MSLCSRRVRYFRALAADAWQICRGSSARKVTADHRTRKRALSIALPRVSPHVLDRTARAARSRRLVDPREWARRSARRWHLGVECGRWGHQRARQNSEGRKPAGPRDRVCPRYYVLRSTGRMRTSPGREFVSRRKHEGVGGRLASPRSFRFHRSCEHELPWFSQFAQHP